MAKQKDLKINDIDYKLQKVDNESWYDMKERATPKGKNSFSEKLLAKEVLEHIVVVPPNLTMNDFDELQDLEELVNMAIQFQCVRQPKI
jgi:hypothetical protein